MYPALEQLERDARRVACYLEANPDSAAARLWLRLAADLHRDIAAREGLDRPLGVTLPPEIRAS